MFVGLAVMVSMGVNGVGVFITFVDVGLAVGVLLFVNVAVDVRVAVPVAVRIGVHVRVTVTVGVAAGVVHPPSMTPVETNDTMSRFGAPSVESELNDMVLYPACRLTVTAAVAQVVQPPVLVKSTLADRSAPFTATDIALFVVLPLAYRTDSVSGCADADETENVSADAAAFARLA